MNYQPIVILRIFWGFTWHNLFKKSIRCMRQCIGGVIAERSILYPLCLFVKTSSFNLAEASGNGNRFFTQKFHVQIANNPRSPQSQAEKERSYKKIGKVNQQVKMARPLPTASQASACRLPAWYSFPYLFC
jgi:hypothetical protein